MRHLCHQRNFGEVRFSYRLPSLMWTASLFQYDETFKIMICLKLIILFLLSLSSFARGLGFSALELLPWFASRLGSGLRSRCLHGWQRLGMNSSAPSSYQTQMNIDLSEWPCVEHSLHFRVSTSSLIGAEMACLSTSHFARPCSCRRPEMRLRRRGWSACLKLQGIWSQN